MTEKARDNVLLVVFVALYLGIFIITYNLANAEMLLDEFWLFVVGNVGSIVKTDWSWDIVWVMLSITSIVAVANIVVAKIMELFFESKKSVVEELIKENGWWATVIGVAVSNILEEVVVRWFFLGVLPMIGALSGVTAFYVLFFVGNSIWTLAHIFNYKGQKKLKILVAFAVLFSMGVVLSFCYVKFGLWATVCIHILMNTSVAIVPLGVDEWIKKKWGKEGSSDPKTGECPLKKVENVTVLE